LAFTAQGFNTIDVFITTTRALLQTYQTTATVKRIVSLPDGSKFYAITSGGKLEAFNPPTWPQDSKLIAAAKSPTRISLQWTPSKTETSAYEILGGPTSILISPTTVNYTVTGLIPTTRYTFTIYIQDTKGEVSISGPSANATTLPDNTPPTWPQGSNVHASNITPISLALTWTNAIDDVSATNYRVYANNTLLLTLGNTTTVVIASLTQKTTYNFQIQAGDQSNNWSTDGPSTSVQTPPQSNLPGPYGIVYAPIFPSAAARGSTITLVSNVSDTGASQIKILSLNINSGIGVFAQGNLPMILQPGTHKLLNLSLTVPADPSASDPTVYYLTTYVTWQYLDPASDTWQSGIPDPLIVNPTLLVLDHPYAPGVSPGNTATYNVSLSTLPNTRVTDVLTVINVTDPEVFYTQQLYVGEVLANTTEGSTNVITGVNKGAIYVPFAFVASNLAIGYPLYSGFQSIPVSSMSDEILTGTTRRCISVTTGQANGPLSLNATWDAYTGLLGNLNAISTNRTSFTAHYTLLSTNVWTVSVSIIQPTTVANQPSTVKFSASVSGGTPPYSYSWDFGDGVTARQPDPTHTYLHAGTYKVSLSVTDKDGNSRTATSTLTVQSPNDVPSIANLLTPGLLRTVFMAWGIYIAFALVLSLILIRRERVKHRHLFA
jgi:chitodextrinase